MRKAYYLAVNKNNDELYAEIVEYDEAHALSLIEKAKRIVNAKTAPARMTEDPSYYACKWCDFQYTCHQDSIGAVNCRTCVHSTPVANAQWKCVGSGSFLTDEMQRKGCLNHLFIPDLVPYAKVVDANPRENWIEYEKPNGEMFKNGQKGWPSIELVNLPAEHTNDQFITDIKKQFKGKVVA